MKNQKLDGTSRLVLSPLLGFLLGIGQLRSTIVGTEEKEAWKDRFRGWFYGAFKPEGKRERERERTVWFDGVATSRRTRPV